MEAVYWAIARNPDEFPPIAKGSNLRLVFTTAFPDVPALRILFEIESEDRCILRDVSIVEDADDANTIGE